MGIKTKRIHINDVELILSTQRVLFIPKFKMLILSDVHIGKTAHFQQHGIPISKQILENDVARLQSAITFFQPEKVVIVGDLFHAGFNVDVQFFKNWLQPFKTIEFILVKGNHDQKQIETYVSNQITIIDDFFEFANFILIHEPPKIKQLGKTYISGHIHPGVVLKGKAKQSITLPCFMLAEQQLLLPAFSEFTGLNTKLKPKKAQIFGFYNDGFVDI